MERRASAPLPGGSGTPSPPALSLPSTAALSLEPLSPPTPTLEHLTQAEIQVLNSVFQRQQEFEQEEAEHVK